MQMDAVDVGVRKRKLDESSTAQHDYDRFAKRFNLLNLASSAHGSHASSSYYIPVSGPLTSSQATTSTEKAVTATATAARDGGLMQVDETHDRVYIHDLDAELADIASDEEKLIFLPDIEKHFSRIPKHVLTGRHEDVEGQELVLYSVPKSLTIDEQQDAVRKAIIDTRQRAREKAMEEARQLNMDRHYGQPMGEAAETTHVELDDEADPDAMDMD